MRGNRLNVLDPVFVAGGILVASGVFHFAWLWVMQAEWSGPISPRKPALFGISGGVTIWSIGWVVKQCSPFRFDRLFARMMAGGLLAEVGLITLQYWRGVPSHFNGHTTLDAVIESIMLVLILIVTIGIAWLCWRSNWLLPMPKARSLSIQAGLWLLLISCGLGFMTTILGETNIAAGLPPEVWGRAGVLKYPHGAALHAIQTLPILAAFLTWLQISSAATIIRQVALSHVFFLAYALWQTLGGRSRFDMDLCGGILLTVSFLLVVLPVGTVLSELFSKTNRPRTTAT